MKKRRKQLTQKSQWDLKIILVLNYKTCFAAYVSNLHSIEHKGAYGEDKFYLRPTNHVTVHGGAIPIQQPPQVAQS